MEANALHLSAGSHTSSPMQRHHPSLCLHCQLPLLSQISSSWQTCYKTFHLKTKYCLSKPSNIFWRMLSFPKELSILSVSASFPSIFSRTFLHQVTSLTLHWERSCVPLTWPINSGSQTMSSRFLLHHDLSSETILTGCSFHSCWLSYAYLADF